MKKFLSLLLSIGLVIGMVPMNVMAQNGPCQDDRFSVRLIREPGLF